MSVPKEAAPENADLFGGWFRDSPSASRVMENQGRNKGCRRRPFRGGRLSPEERAGAKQAPAGRQSRS